MSKIIKEGKRSKLKTEKVQFTMNGRKYTLYVKKVEEMAITQTPCEYKISLDMECTDIKSEPIYDPRKDFAEDVRALAKQYGLTLKRVEVK